MTAISYLPFISAQNPHATYELVEWTNFLLIFLESKQPFVPFQLYTFFFRCGSCHFCEKKGKKSKKGRHGACKLCWWLLWDCSSSKANACVSPRGWRRGQVQVLFPAARQLQSLAVLFASKIQIPTKFMWRGDYWGHLQPSDSRMESQLLQNSCCKSENSLRVSDH